MQSRFIVPEWKKMLLKLSNSQRRHTGKERAGEREGAIITKWFGFRTQWSLQAQTQIRDECIGIRSDLGLMWMRWDWVL